MPRTLERLFLQPAFVSAASVLTFALAFVPSYFEDEMIAQIVGRVGMVLMLAVFVGLLVAIIRASDRKAGSRTPLLIPLNLAALGAWALMSFGTLFDRGPPPHVAVPLMLGWFAASAALFILALLRLIDAAPRPKSQIEAFGIFIALSNFPVGVWAIRKRLAAIAD